jgi:RNA polymerase sigma-70 factor (ECF subfamily)
MGITTESDSGLAMAIEADSSVNHDALYEQISAEYTAPLTRLARAHEADPSLQQDLLQDIHIAIWRSLPAFGGRCSLRTWVYRVAHNVAATHVMRRRRRLVKDLVSLDDIEIAAESPDAGTELDESRMLARIRALVQRLKPLDREVFVLYLEGMSMEDIAEIAGLSQTNTRTKLHRIRALLATRLNSGVNS